MKISNFAAYIAQLWRNKPDTRTPLSAERLCHIEDGIKGNSDAIEAIAAAVVNQIVNDPDKIASMAALYAVNQKVSALDGKVGDTAQLPDGATDVVTAITKQNSDLSVKSVVDQFTAPANTKVTYAYKYGNVVVLTIAISGIKDGWNYINLTTKYSVVCPAVASIHKSTGVDKDIFVSCTFNGTSVTVLANANFNGDLTANFVLIVR